MARRSIVYLLKCKKESQDVINETKNVPDWATTKYRLPRMERMASGKGVHPPQ